MSGPITVTLTLVAVYPSGERREIVLDPISVPTITREDGFLAVDGDDALARIAASLRKAADEIDQMLGEP